MTQGSNNSLTSTAYSRVTEMIHLDIVEGRLPPQSRLKVNELAQRYGVSPSPVREALQQLQTEGIVVLLPNRGAIVRGIDPIEFTHMMHVRAAIEGMQARICASIADSRLLDTLERLAHEFQDGAQDEVDVRHDTNRAFHRAINTADGSLVAAEIIDRVSNMMAAVRRAWPFGQERVAAAAVEHFEILAAIRAGDGPAAEEAARLHVLNGLADIMERMRAGGALTGDDPLGMAGARVTRRAGRKARP